MSEFLENWEQEGCVTFTVSCCKVLSSKSASAFRATLSRVPGLTAVSQKCFTKCCFVFLVSA